MKSLPCDQIIADILEARRSCYRDTCTDIYVSPTEIERLIDQIEQLEKSEPGLDAVRYLLELRGIEDVDEYRVYAAALRAITDRRRKFKQRMKDNATRGRWAPFAPR